MARKVPVTVVEEVPPDIVKRGAVPSTQSVATRTVEVGLDVLNKQLKERLQDLHSILTGLPDKVGDFEPTELSVSFAVTASGEVSLLSAVKGGLGVTATFVLKLSRRG